MSDRQWVRPAPMPPGRVRGRLVGAANAHEFRPYIWRARERFLETVSRRVGDGPGDSDQVAIEGRGGNPPLSTTPDD